jgi:hypothetical protein
MPAGGRRNPVLANPFYVALMAVSTVFVVTALAYLVVPYVLQRDGGVLQGDTSRGLAGWLDRQGPLILGVEFVVMLATGVAAMFTDDWFTRP